MAVHIGTSGWSYAHWTGVLYPEGTQPERRLDYYVRRFGTTELNASYYRWPAEGAFGRWHRHLPDGFVMSVKAPGALTHWRRLFGPEAWLTRIAEGLRRLGTRLGALLIQLPPGFEADHQRLAYFLKLIPPQLRVAIEFRNPTWHQDSTFALLEEHGVAYCVMSGARLPCVLRATGRFVYVRLHGPDHQQLYGGSYSEDDLRWWRDRIHEWQGMRRDVFVYFNNDGNGHAARNAARLKELMGQCDARVS